MKKKKNIEMLCSTGLQLITDYLTFCGELFIEATAYRLLSKCVPH